MGYIIITLVFAVIVGLNILVYKVFICKDDDNKIDVDNHAKELAQIMFIRKLMSSNDDFDKKVGMDAAKKYLKQNQN